MHEALCRQIKIWPIKGRGLGHVTNFDILAPLNIFGIIKVRNFVFGAHNEYNNVLANAQQFVPQSGRGQGHVT